MDMVPDDILLEIFSYFSTGELYSAPFYVCHRWKNVIEIICLRINCKNDLLRLSEGRYYLRAIEVSTHIDYLAMLLDGLGALYARLREFKLRNCNPVGMQYLTKIATSFPNLEHIDIFLIENECIYCRFFDYMKNVKCLVWNNAYSLSTLRMLSEKCTQLKEFHMYGKARFYPVLQLQRFLDNACWRLTKLTLRCGEVNNKVCIAIGACSNLRELRLFHCWLMTMSGLRNITNIENLEVLHVTGLKLVNKNELYIFIKSLKGRKLCKLNFSSTAFGDEHISLLSQVCPNIKTLELWSCKELSPEAIQCIPSMFPFLYMLDLNCELTLINIKNISKECRIQFLRLCLSEEVKHSQNGFNFKILDCFESLEGNYFVGGREGFSASLLYHCNFDHIYNT